jgi:ribosomal protein S18 acetylase RimI-like enzyme
MQRTFDRAIPVIDLPAGLLMVSYEPAYDVDLRQTHIEAFRDHWGSSPIDEERWKLWFTGSRGFRAGLSRLILDGDKIVSYVLAYEYVADTEATGVREVYIGHVGTLRSHRKRGLARVALADVMTEAQRRGYQRAALGVDTQNGTGALGLYEGLGFMQYKKFIAYRLPLS